MEITQDYPDWSSIRTRVFKSGKRRQQRRVRGCHVRGSHCLLLALKMEEEVMSPRMQEASRGWEKQGNRFSSRKEHSSANTSFLTKWDLCQTSGLQT